jgi:hypothetical protein
VKFLSQVYVPAVERLKKENLLLENLILFELYVTHKNNFYDRNPLETRPICVPILKGQTPDPCNL